MQNSEKTAFILTLGIIVVICTFVIVWQTLTITDYEKQQIYRNAYWKGYIKGKEDASEQILQIVHQQNQELRNELNNN